MADAEKNDRLKLKLFGPVAESAGSTIQGIWQLVFGGIDLYCQKKNYLRTKAFEEFKASVEQKVIEIPAESLQEPKIAILGPAIEASKFYFEEKPLREMFAALAAASMDKRKERNLHPSFPEIIKQMSPLDAKNLSFFHSQLPVAEYYYKNRNSKVKRTVLSNVFLANHEEQDLELQSQSLASLSRLGLIEVEYERFILADKFYTNFFTTDYFLQLSSPLNPDPKWIPGVTFGRARTTPLGKSFMSVCLE